MRSIIQVGVGGMGAVWTDRVAESKRWEAAAYVDVNKANLLAAAQRHGMSKKRCFQDFRAALRAVEADALLDVTPPQSRKHVCLEAFKHGLDVLAEKPLADSVKNAVLMVRRAEEAGQTLMVAQDYRYQAIVQTAKHFVEKGRLGEVGYAGVNFHKGPRFGGYREEMAYPLLLDMSIHHVDLMRCMLGADVKTVQGCSIGAPWNWNRGDASVMAQLAMTNGVLVNYFASCVGAGWETGWNADWRVEGSKGVLLLERDELYLSNKPGRRRKVPLRKWPLTRQAYLLEAFADALDSGVEPETGAKNNLNSLAATHALVRAGKEKRCVSVRELLK